MYQITLVTQNTPCSLAVKDVMKMEHSPWNHYIIDNSAWFWITFSWWLVNPSLNFNPASLRCLYTVLKYKLSTYVGHIHAFLAENWTYQQSKHLPNSINSLPCCSDQVLPNDYRKLITFSLIRPVIGVLILAFE